MHKTGATRYQKFLKAEKGKTKFKGKKDTELPKGTNITKTNFKVKKIVIKEQLKKHNLQETLFRNLSAKELLSRLEHFNTRTCSEALNGLSEMVTSHPGLMLENLGQFINSVTPLILNVEKIVRQAALKVLHLVLSNVPESNVEPFLCVLSPYLRNAMTHIDVRIQEDAIVFLDILLTCIPMLLAEDFHKIFPNFLDMVSKVRLDQPGRVLTMNLNTQITSIKWRVKVFQRLEEFMRKYCDYNKIDKADVNVQSKTHFFDPKSFNYYPLFDPINIANYPLPCFSIMKNSGAIIVDESERFNEYSDVLLPLIFESWQEACPSTKSNTDFETVISEDSALLLSYILKIFKLIFLFHKHYVKENPDFNINKFYQKYKQQFTKHFLNLFPYVTTIRSKQVNTNVVLKPSLIMENLELCHVFVKFNPNVNIKKQGEEISAVLSYIEKIFCQSKHDDVVDDKIIDILHSLFSGDSIGWSRTLLVLESLLREIIKVYFNKSISNTFKQKIFGLMCNIALNNKLSHFHSIDAFQMWLKNLPDILLGENINVDTVTIIHRFSVTNNKVFNDVLRPKLPSIIRNLPNIKITNAENICSYHKLFSILHYIKGWDTESLNILEKQLIDNAYNADSGKFIFDMLKLRSGVGL